MKKRISFDVFKSLWVAFRYAFGCGAVQKLKKVKAPVLSFPVLNQEKCVGCKLCMQVCPTHAIKVITKIEENQLIPLFEHEKNKCVLCGLCVQSCPEKALTLEVVEE